MDSFLPAACRGTFAQAAELGMRSAGRGARRKKRRGKKKAARKTKRKAKARKLKFGSPAWRKKYMKRG